MCNELGVSFAVFINWFHTDTVVEH